MNNHKSIEGFFVENEDKFTEEQLISSIEKLKKHAKLIGREGRVHIEDKTLSGTDKLKLFLVTRYLGAELGKIKPELKINPEIKVINNKQIQEFLSIDSHNARARMSTVSKEGFAKKTVKGKIEVEPFQVERFLNQLENKNLDKKLMPNKVKKAKTKKGKQKTEEMIEVNIEDLYEKLSEVFDVDKDKLKDVLYIKSDGSFKFNTKRGSSKSAEQRNCILVSAQILLRVYNQKTFNTRKVSDICFHSNIDTSGLNSTIRDMKKADLISKEGRRSQANILREKGKQLAQKLMKELCE